jgi:hypothetical protein
VYRVKPFIFQLGARPWPPDVTALQVYALVNLKAERELAAVIEGCRKVAQEFLVTPVEDPWLHITLDQVTDQPGSRISADERRRIADRLRRHLATFPGFGVTAGSPIAAKDGILLDLHPDNQLAALHRAVRSAVHEVRGPSSTNYPVLPCHLTVGYARGQSDTDTVQSELRRRVRPGHASLQIRNVHLVEVSPDLENKQIRWDTETVVEIPLAPAT